MSDYKSLKQLIKNRDKIKLDLYENLYNAIRKKHKKIFDLLIITYYDSIDFNKDIYGYNILFCIIKYKSKHLNFILNLYVNGKIDLNKDKLLNNIIKYGSFKSFKILIDACLNNKINLKFNIPSIFTKICCYKQIKYIKLFIKYLKFKKLSIKNLLLEKDCFGFRILEY